MAVPSELSNKGFSGRFSMNNKLSDKIDEVLKLQGVSWLSRQASSVFEVTLAMKLVTDEAGVEHIHIDKKVSGGINVPSEVRPLDGLEREEEDKIFGHVVKKARRFTLDEITDEYLKKDWTDDTIESGIVITESWSSPDKNKNKWKMIQAGGFGMVDGEKRHVVLSVFTAEKKAEPIYTRFIYDYLGPI